MSVSEQTRKAFKMIEEGVQQLRSSEKYRDYLRSLSKFHDYSFNNTLLILSQCPNASMIAGFNTWKNEFNRRIRKGEKSIKILAPYKVKHSIIKKETDENGNETHVEKQISITKFRPVNVFDVSQTEGDALPSLTKELIGSSESSIGLIEAIKEISEIPVLFKTKEEDPSLVTAKGYFQYGENGKFIVIRKDMDINQQAKTLLHEFAHSILHENSTKEKRVKEIEAESLAFVVSNHFGLDTSDYSFGYIQSWSSNKSDKELKDVLEDIQEHADKLIEMIEPVFKRRMIKDDSKSITK